MVTVVLGVVDDGPNRHEIQVEIHAVSVANYTQCEQSDFHPSQAYRLSSRLVAWFNGNGKSVNGRRLVRSVRSDGPCSAARTRTAVGGSQRRSSHLVGTAPVPRGMGCRDAALSGWGVRHGVSVQHEGRGGRVGGD